MRIIIYNMCSSLFCHYYDSHSDHKHNDAVYMSYINYYVLGKYSAYKSTN